MEQNKSLHETPEQVILIPQPRRIIIDRTLPLRAYGLFDTKTGTQVKDFIKGNGEQIEFSNLDPSIHYDVGVIENMGDDKPIFAINWTLPMRDDTDTILSNSNNLPVVYPYVYEIPDDETKSVIQDKRTFDLTDDKKEVVAQAVNLTSGDDKLEFLAMHTFAAVDDTK